MNELLKYIHSLTAFSTESCELLQPALTQQTFGKKQNKKTAIAWFDFVTIVTAISRRRV
jgi:hypothetical protein